MKTFVFNQGSANCPIWLTILVLLLGPALAVPTFAHEFDDGFVERTMYVVIRDRTVTVEYSVGCSAKTREDMVAKWESTVTPTTSATDQAGENVASTTNEPKIAQTIEQRFQNELLAQISQTLVIKAAGRRFQPTPVSVSNSPRHHVDAVATLTLELPEVDSLTLEIEDAMFADNDGGVRYAAKSNGFAVMSRSNVATIIVRADRIELSALTPEQRLEKAKVECQLVFVSSEKK